MIQKTYTFNSMDEFRNGAASIRGEAFFSDASEKILLAWAQLWEEEEFSAFRDELKKLFPDCTAVGTNHLSSNDILHNRIDGTGEDKGIILSLLQLESSSASLFSMEMGRREEEKAGIALNGFIKEREAVKGIFLIPPDYFCSAEALLKEGMKGTEGIKVFGIKTSLLPGYQTFGWEKGGELRKRRLFALILHGKSLDIRMHYNLGWTPVGKVMTVTKEENPFFVDEVDGKPAACIYNRYLGLRDDQIIPDNLSEFPLIIQRDDLRISRIGVTGPKKGQLVFGAPVYLNDRICLSYGNPDALFSEVRRDSEEVLEFGPQAGFLIVCANRIMLLKDREKEEIGYYKRYMKEAVALYGYAEIFYIDGRGGELNSALVSVALRETGTENEEAEELRETGKEAVKAAAEAYGSPSEAGGDINVPFIDRLSRFFKEISEDLLQAVEEAEEANRAKSAFFSCISHEFRTPLNSILGMNEMILRESGEGRLKEYAENIESSGRLLLQLVNDILDTEKIEAGKMEIIPVEYDIKTVIREIVRMMSPGAHAKGLKLKLKVTGELPDVLFGDENRLRQCIINLLNNAVKYTQEGEVFFSVFAEMVDPATVRLDISVKDTGIGIREEDIEKLSLPFERVDTSKNYNVEGSGLGLGIVKNLLELMGSRLVIKSSYGEGSEFSFSILQEVRCLKKEKAPKQPEPEKRSGACRFTDTSVLVVDDTPMNIDVIRVFLRNTGINVDSAPDGMTAIGMLREKKYDIILLDHRMPGMDGIETFKRIRSDSESRNRDSVFIMLTANEAEGARERFVKEEGFDDFIAKPVKMKELEEIIKRHVPPEKARCE
ncbi:MAG TPA: hypothetical protein DCL38_04905 [Lachnospiraceae bacterium]|nr:hypothetical protein [Lachnospiraceae bacterium]